MNGCRKVSTSVSEGHTEIQKYIVRADIPHRNVKLRVLPSSELGIYRRNSDL